MFKKRLSLILLFIIFLIPFSLHKHDGVIKLNYNEAFAVDGGGGNGQTTSAAVPLKNPMCPKDNNGDCVDDIPSFVKAMLDIVMKVGVPLVAVAIIYTGYLFIAAQGKPDELKKAKDALVYVFIGAMILLGAYVIAQALQGTINAIRGV